MIYIFTFFAVADRKGDAACRVEDDQVGIVYIFWNSHYATACYAALLYESRFTGCLEACTK